ncbi:LuxR C-terminal-related transcriptional regulator [Pontixanthobacter sp. CEM42]|uniref:helix-turn-helix transcriptional regulator n=1 Tax=Pontixanthobacter sp. CEM42 TaxID=2792077 RepID=UPI001ADED677|nr:LuxR C-terminal-related transcriptional regulator [Pontixanthobacter sp. CEM42]
MAGAAKKPLTEKQRAVMERIDRRVPIAVIADEMGVSETRINQHIRTLKDRFGVENLNALVEQYRLSSDYTDAPEGPLRKPKYSFPQAAKEPVFSDQQSRVDPGEIVLSDSHHVLIDAPWTGSREPVVVPSKLDGEQAVLYRSIAMLGIAAGIAAAVILTVSAALTVSEVLDGTAEIRTDMQGS